ncbi:MAG: hypothetical protein ACYCS9_00440 [Candidatus Dormibacteria bacterium]
MTSDLTSKERANGIAAERADPPPQGEMTLSSLLSVLAAAVAFFTVLLPTVGVVTRAVAIAIGAGLDPGSALSLAMDAPLGGLIASGVWALLYVVLAGVSLWLGLRYLLGRQLRDLERGTHRLQTDVEFLEQESAYLQEHDMELQQAVDAWRESEYSNLPPLLERYVEMSARTKLLGKQLESLRTGQWPSIGAFLFAAIPGSRSSRAVTAAAVILPILALALFIFGPSWPISALYYPIGVYGVATIPRLIRFGIGPSWREMLPHVCLMMLASAIVAGIGGEVAPVMEARFTFSGAARKVLPDGVYVEFGSTSSEVLLATCGLHPRVFAVSDASIVAVRIQTPSPVPNVSLYGVITNHEKVVLGFADVC